jgi:cell division protease FtsH
MIGMLGGRAAEDIVFSDITSGASNDLERVTKLARTMVTRLGMSEELGPMVYGKKEELVFLGREISEQRDYSEHIAEKIDTAIQKIVVEAYQEAKSILTKYREELDKIAEKLLDVETLDADAFYEIFPTPVEKTGGIPEKVKS